MSGRLNLASCLIFIPFQFENYDGEVGFPSPSLLSNNSVPSVASSVGAKRMHSHRPFIIGYEDQALCSVTEDDACKLTHINVAFAAG